MTPTELASLEALAKAEPVAWRSVMNDPPVAMSVLARFFDNELGEWVYTVFDPGPVKLSIAGPYSEWLPLDTFNRTMYADNPAAILSLIEEYKRMREALERVRDETQFCRVRLQIGKLHPFPRLPEFATVHRPRLRIGLVVPSVRAAFWLGLLDHRA